MDHEHLILFDGFCHLCDGTVQFILKHDKRQLFSFASLQSTLGKKIVSELKIDTSKGESIIYIRKNKTLQKSDAALWIAAELNFPAQLIGGLVIFPTYLRNFVYDMIARNRYKWFGKSETCMIPDEKYKTRFLDL